MTDPAASRPNPFRDDAPLPAWAVAALRAPLDGDPAHTAAGKARVVALVRAAPRHRHTLRAPRPRWARRRGVLAPACAALLAAGLGGLAGLGRYDNRAAVHRPDRDAPHAGGGATVGGAAVVGDTVVARVVVRERAGDGRAGGPQTLRDTLLDTLWRVRFVLRDSTAEAVAVLGDFNGWRRPATPLARVTPAAGTGARTATGTWAATVVVPRDAVRYAFVVDGRVRGAGAIPRRPAAPRPAPAQALDSV